jgi:fibronectin-binding autotransporter adhesin
MAALVLTATPAGAASIAVPNAGFEVRETYNQFVDGYDDYLMWGKESWRHWQRSDNGGPVRIWNPGLPGIPAPRPNQNALVSGFGGNAPEGTYVTLVRSRYSDGANTDGVNYFEAATQLLTTTFDLYTAYTMTVAVGNPPGGFNSPYYYTPNWFGYAVQLAVGGTNVGGATYAGSVTGGTIIAQDVSSLTVPLDSFVTSTVTFHPDPTNPALQALVGKPLQIRLCALEDQTNLARTGYAVFDDVKLESVSARYWDINGATAGAGGATPAGTWNAVDPNWNSDYSGGAAGSVTAWSAGSVACFGAGTDATGTYTVTVDGTRDIRGLNFQDGTVTLTGGALRMTLNSGVEVAAGLTATIETPITEDVAGRVLIKKGDGTLVLSGANTYSGGTSVLAGTLRLGADDVLPNMSVVTVSGNAPGVTATLDLYGHSDTIGSLSLGGGSSTSGAAVTTGAGTLTLGGNVDYDRSCNPLGATISGKINLGTATRTFTVNDSATAAIDLSVSAPISGTDVGLTKAGAGTLLLSGNNTYTGLTTMSAGKLILSGDNVAATGGMAIDGGAAQFESPASINGTLRDVSVNAGGAVVFGASFGAGNIPSALATRIVADSAGTIAADNYDTMNFDFNTPGLMGARLGAVGSVAYVGALTPQGTTYRLGGGGGTLTMANANAVTGAGYSLVVSGNVVLPAANDYTGGTTLVAGKLAVGTDSSISSNTLTFNGGGISSDSTTARTIASPVVFAGNGVLGDAVNTGKLTFTNTADLGSATRTLTLASDAEFAGVVSGIGGGLTKAGAGTLTLSNNNTYTGGTTLSAGTLIIGNAGALGAGRFTIAGAGTVAAAGTIVITNPVDGNSNFTIAGTGALTLGGTMTLSANRTITNNNITSATTFGAISGGGGSCTTTFSGDGSTAVTGIIDTGSGGLTKNGTGTLTLSNDASTYTGVTSIAGGTLSVSTLANGGSPSSIGASANADTNLVLANGTTLKYTGPGGSTDRRFKINGTAAGHGATLDASGAGPIYFANATGPTYGTNNQARTLNLIGSNTGENTLAANIGNNGSGALSVVKGGEGKWVLSGANTYTGGTTVNGGTLLVNNASGSGTGTGTVTVNANGALGGIGVIGGAVTVNGALAPGAGTLTVNNNLTMETGSTYVWHVGSDNKAGLVGINGTLSMVSSWRLALANNGGTLGTGEYNLFTYDTFSDVFTLPTIYYGNTGWSNATVALDETGRRIYLKFGRPGDTNEDGAVDAADFITLKKNFGAGVGGGAGVGNFDKTGTVNWADLSILMSNMGAGGGAPATAPEPCSAILLIFGAAALLRRKRRS